MLSIFYTLCYVIAVLLLGALVWAFFENRKPAPSTRFLFGMNLVHYVVVLTFAVGVVAALRGEFPTQPVARDTLAPVFRFLEYVGAYTMLGVLYMRGLYPNGWVHKIMTTPPRVAQGMMLASGWSAMAMLGYVLRFIQGAA
ncbi:MAG: hypothetical protein HC933_13130 [Pleurocapsa sp. SU_196_0]|nr:hypothetical protein [Pleurocapsa sp. SU_196_0]